MLDTDSLLAIITLVLLLASFAIGLRCFADFDRGLQESKTRGMMVFVNAFPNHANCLDVAVRHGANTLGLSPSTSQKQDSSGIPLGRRVSIE